MFGHQWRLEVVQAKIHGIAARFIYIQSANLRGVNSFSFLREKTLFFIWQVVARLSRSAQPLPCIASRRSHYDPPAKLSDLLGRFGYLLQDA